MKQRHQARSVPVVSRSGEARHRLAEEERAHRRVEVADLHGQHAVKLRPVCRGQGHEARVRFSLLLRHGPGCQGQSRGQRRLLLCGEKSGAALPRRRHQARFAGGQAEEVQLRQPQLIRRHIVSFGIALLQRGEEAHGLRQPRGLLFRIRQPRVLLLAEGRHALMEHGVNQRAVGGAVLALRHHQHGCRGAGHDTQDGLLELGAEGHAAGVLSAPGPLSASGPRAGSASFPASFPRAAAL